MRVCSQREQTKLPKLGQILDVQTVATCLHCGAPDQRPQVPQTPLPSLNLPVNLYLQDLRNHGESPHAAPMNYSTMADDVAALLDSQQLRQPVLLGHSMCVRLLTLIVHLHCARCHTL